MQGKGLSQGLKHWDTLHSFFKVLREHRSSSYCADVASVPHHCPLPPGGMALAFLSSLRVWHSARDLAGPQAEGQERQRQASGFEYQSPREQAEKGLQA